MLLALVNERQQNQIRKLLVKEVMSVRPGKTAHATALELDAVIDGPRNMTAFSH